jgi:hypothetical protein
MARLRRRPARRRGRPRVRGREVLDDGTELAALAVGEDARDLDVESVAREPVGGAEHPVRRRAPTRRARLEDHDSSACSGAAPTGERTGCARATAVTQCVEQARPGRIAATTLAWSRTSSWSALWRGVCPWALGSALPGGMRPVPPMARIAAPRTAAGLGPWLSCDSGNQSPLASSTLAARLRLHDALRHSGGVRSSTTSGPADRLSERHGDSYAPSCMSGGSPCTGFGTVNNLREPVHEPRPSC